MIDDDLDDLARIAERAVSLGYNIVRNVQPGEIHTKGDRDIVTNVDLAVEREIRTFLEGMTPRIGFLGEEEGSVSSDARDEMWVLDPIDGTSNFARGVPLHAISLALISKGQPAIGAIIAPSLGLKYLAVRGRGAVENGRTIQAGATRNLSKAIVSIGDYAVGDGSEQKNALRLQITGLLANQVERVRMFGSAALDLAWVAAGRTDATVMLSNKPWDTAAGVLLAREAGADVLDTAGAQHHTSSLTTVAACSGLTAPLLSLLEAAATSASSDAAT